MDSDITELLRAAEGGNEDAAQRLYSLVYDQLRVLALRQRGSWRGDETLNTTALVNEAYLKLVSAADQQWQSRGHFFAVAARAMRQILVDKARQRSSAKRGANAVHQPIDEARVAADPMSDSTATEILTLHELLDELESTHPRQARVIECRFFGGLKIEETCQALGIAASTVRRDWELAKIWLHQRLSEQARAG